MSFKVPCELCSQASPQSAEIFAPGYEAELLPFASFLWGSGKDYTSCKISALVICETIEWKCIYLLVIHEKPLKLPSIVKFCCISGREDYPRQSPFKWLASTRSGTVWEFSIKIQRWITLGVKGDKFCDQACRKGIARSYFLSVPNCDIMSCCYRETFCVFMGTH